MHRLVTQYAMRIVLEELKVLGWTGLDVNVGNGVVFKCFPLPAVWVCDLEEAWALLAMLNGGSGARFPCVHTLMPRASLNDPDAKYSDFPSRDSKETAKVRFCCVL